MIFGPNAAGKSNFLDALDLLSSLSSADTVSEAFEKHRGNRLDRQLPIRRFFYQEKEQSSPLTMNFEVDFELQPRIIDELNTNLEEREELENLERSYTRVTQSSLRYELSIEYHTDRRALYVTHEYLAPLRKDGKPKDNIVPYIRQKDRPSKISVKLERQSHPRYYELPRTRTLLSEISDWVNHPHLIATARELKSTQIYYVEPARMRATVSDIDASDPGPHGEKLASFFHWLKREHPGQFKNLTHNLTRLIPSIESIDVREAYEGFMELWVQEKESGEFPASLISEGTLRLVCLLGIAATPKPPAIVGYEEPENGVNPARLGEMLAILENAAGQNTGTQFFLTSHSPEVLNFFKEHDLFYCESGGEGSTLTPYDQLPLFKDSDLREKLGDVYKGRSKVGDEFKRGDFG